MIEATCTACGNINHVPDADIPVGAKFVNCASCKSRVAISTKAAIGAAPPKLPPIKPPPMPPIPGKPPLVKTSVVPDTVGIADLPAPKRGSALGAEASKPAPRSGLAAALDGELPAPRGPRSALPAKLPPVTATTPAPIGEISFDDLLPPGIELGSGVDPALDLDADPAEPALDLAAFDSPGIVDLPTPKTSRGIHDVPVAKPADSLADVGSARPKDISDLPTPKKPAIASKPAPTKPSATDGILDLPAPKGPARAAHVTPPAASPIAPPPVDAGPPAIIDLPTPKGPGGLLDLPTPKLAPTADLPTPKVPAGIVDLPTPKPGGIGDLPAPKGFFDDLPQPARASQQNRPATPQTPDLPAPKGFFDDLPGRVNPSKPAKPELPAPKGFFDDLPGRVNPNKPGSSDVPAPKGFFDDLPGRVNPNKPGSSDVPAPLGFFDDLPGRVNPSKPGPSDVPAPKGFFDDLPQPARTRPESAGQELVSIHAHDDLEPVLDSGPELGPELDLGPSSSQFDDLDLSKPSTGQGHVVAARPPTSQPTAAGSSLPPSMHGDVTIELAEPRAASITPKLATKRAKIAPVADPDAARQRAKRVRLLALVGLAVIILGGGGFVLYRRHAAKQEIKDQIANELATAQSAMAATDRAHWDRAFRAAKKVLELEDKQPEALGIAAESQLAAGLADGTNAPMKFSNGRKYIASAIEASVAGAPLVRAQALSAIAAKQPERAIEKLRPLSEAAPTDATLALYLGWAQAAHGDDAEAIKAFDAAAANGADSIKLHALYGRGLAKLARADLAGARADFTSVLEIDKAHIGAQVGIAAALPVAQSQQQEGDLLAILARKDLDAGDPRAVVHAWVLAAEAARRGNRLDAARERFRKALVLAPEDLPSLTGLADVEVRDGKLDAAAELAKKALDLSKDDLHAQLVKSEIAIQRKELKEASTILDALAARKPPPPVVDQARIKLLIGRVLEAQGDDAAAVESYLEAAGLAGELDLTPTLAAVARLAALADKATEAKDLPKAAALRARAEQLLASLAGNAEKDPQLALTLGMAYLQAGDAGKAAPWLQRVVEARPKDVDGHYQLAKALSKLGKSEEAIKELQGAIDLDPTRTEIGLELARTYEAASRDPEAGTLYGKLLDASKDPSIELRARAGRFFARTGQLDKAAEQGAKILAIEPTHPAGQYLKAEGLLAADRIDEARKLFAQAVDSDRDPQYLDGQGRAAEAAAIKQNDSRAQDAALRAYMAAVELDPKLFNSLAGQGRLYVLRNEAAKAVPPLLAAYNLRHDADVAYNIGRSYKDLLQNAAAIQWLQESIKLRPNADASWALGQLYVDANQGRQAAAAITTATELALKDEKATGKLNPWLAEAYYRLGRVQKDEHNDAAARTAWERYVERNPPPSAQLDDVRQALATSLKGN